MPRHVQKAVDEYSASELGLANVDLTGGGATSIMLNLTGARQIDLYYLFAKTGAPTVGSIDVAVQLFPPPGVSGTAIAGANNAISGIAPATLADGSTGIYTIWPGTGANDGTAGNENQSLYQTHLGSGGGAGADDAALRGGWSWCKIQVVTSTPADAASTLSVAMQAAY